MGWGGGLAAGALGGGWVGGGWVRVTNLCGLRLFLSDVEHVAQVAQLRLRRVHVRDRRAEAHPRLSQTRCS